MKDEPSNGFLRIENEKIRRQKEAEAVQDARLPEAEEADWLMEQEAKREKVVITGSKYVSLKCGLFVQGSFESRQNHEGPGTSELLDLFLEKIVLINIDRFRVKGKLVAYAGNSKNGHVPGMLVLKSERGIILVRGAWTSIGEEKQSCSEEENS